MRKRTPKEKQLNVLYQSRLYKKRQLVYKAFKFIQWLYMHRPAGIQPAHLRHVHARIAHILRLPYNWDEDDLKRAHAALDLLMKEIYNTKMNDFSGGYQDLLVAMLDTLQIYRASTEDRANVVAELMFNIAVELHGVYGENKPGVRQPMLMALAVEKPPYPRWVVEEMADFILSHFRQSECIEISNMLYDKLEKMVKTQNDIHVMELVEENTKEEMVVDMGGGQKGHTIG